MLHSPAPQREQRWAPTEPQADVLDGVLGQTYTPAIIARNHDRLSGIVRSAALLYYAHLVHESGGEGQDATARALDALQTGANYDAIGECLDSDSTQANQKSRTLVHDMGALANEALQGYNPQLGRVRQRLGHRALAFHHSLNYGGTERINAFALVAQYCMVTTSDGIRRRMRLLEHHLALSNRAPLYYVATQLSAEVLTILATHYMAWQRATTQPATDYVRGVVEQLLGVGCEPRSMSELARELPPGQIAAVGQHLVTFAEMGKRESIQALLPMDISDDGLPPEATGEPLSELPERYHELTLAQILDGLAVAGNVTLLHRRIIELHAKGTLRIINPRVLKNVLSSVGQAFGRYHITLHPSLKTTAYQLAYEVANRCLGVDGRAVTNLPDAIKQMTPEAALGGRLLKVFTGLARRVLEFKLRHDPALANTVFAVITRPAE